MTHIVLKFRLHKFSLKIVNKIKVSCCAPTAILNLKIWDFLIFFWKLSIFYIKIRALLYQTTYGEQLKRKFRRTFLFELSLVLLVKNYFEGQMWSADWRIIIPNYQSPVTQLMARNQKLTYYSTYIPAFMSWHSK